MDEIKYIDIKEFREFGYLQEVNRKFLHPLGLALSVSIDGDIIKLDGIWDYRDDDEGMIFDNEILDVDKAKRVNEAYQEKAKYRKKRFGWEIQPAS